MSEDRNLAVCINWWMSEEVKQKIIEFFIFNDFKYPHMTLQFCIEVLLFYHLILIL